MSLRGPESETNSFAVPADVPVVIAFRSERRLRVKADQMRRSSLGLAAVEVETCRLAQNHTGAVCGLVRRLCQYTAPRAVIGQSCSTRLLRMQTYQS